MKLLIRSKDRTSNSNSSADYYVNFNQMTFTPKIGCGCGCAKSNNCELIYAQIPNSIYNITSSNNSLNLNDGTATFTITVPVGNYTISALCTALASVLTTGSSGHGGLTFTATYSSTTFFITIAAGGNFTLNFASVSTTISGILGYSTSANLSGAATYTGTLIPGIYFPENLEINVTEFPQNCLSTWANNNRISFIIPVNVDAGNIIEYSSLMQFKQQVALSSNFSSLHINLLSGGNIVNLNGADWSMILAINEGCSCEKNKK